MAQRLSLDNHDGFGPRDFTRFLLDRDQFLDAKKNEPVLFDFTVAEAAGVPNWAIPERGAYVRFEDDAWKSRDAGVPDGLLFTGYVTDPPALTYLGAKDGREDWGYALKCTSDEFLCNVKQVPARTFINKTRGYILKALLEEMFSDAANRLTTWSSKAPATITVHDDFNRADGPLGTSWLSFYRPDVPLVIDGARVREGGVWNNRINSGALWTESTATPNQTSEIAVSGMWELDLPVGLTAAGQAWVRITGPTPPTIGHYSGYYADLSYSFAYNEWVVSLWKVTNGIGSGLASALLGSSVPADGDRLRLEVSGTDEPLLKAFYNDSLLCSASDTYDPLTLGQPGFVWAGSQSPMDPYGPPGLEAYVDNWVGTWEG